MVDWPKYFTWSNETGAEVGKRVEWDAHEGFAPFPAGSGVITMIWFGMEESVDVLLDDGTTKTLFPAEGLNNVRVVKGDTDG